ncbi:O-antigen/teichoic acid export membrane protein [Marmoricola sp. URHA0025 HA25]
MTESSPDAAVATPAAPRGTTGGRATLVTIDQAISSITNLLAVLWVAHAGTAVEFGTFSLILLVYTVVAGLTQAVISMSVVVQPDDADHRPREVIGSAVALGVPFGLLCLVIGCLQTLAGWTIGPSLVALGLALPALVVHDVGRAIAIARSAPIGAVLLDATWLVAVVASFALVEVFDVADLFWLTLAWAGSGALASLWVFAQHGILRPHEISLAWLRRRWDQSWRLLVGNITASGSALLGASLMTFVSSPVSVAAVRASILLGRPASAVQLAVEASTAADISREKPDNRGLMRHQRRTMLISTVVALLNVGVLVVLPDPVGKAVLGNMWPVIDPLILPISLWLLVSAAQSGVPPALIGRHQFHLAMVVQVVTGLLNVVALVGGAALGGTEGAVWGLVLGQVGMTIGWCCALVWHLRRSSDR